MNSRFRFARRRDSCVLLSGCTGRAARVRRPLRPRRTRALRAPWCVQGTLYLITLLLASTNVLAQRGVPAPPGPPGPPPASPTVREMPDAFNTAVLAPRRWAIDGLSGEVLYGLERRTTVGFRAPYTLGAGLAGMLLIGGTLRYRVWDAGPWSSAFSVSGSYGVFDRAKGTGLKHLSLAATIAYQRTRAHALALSAYGGGLKLVSLGTAAGVDWRMLMATSTHYPSRWFGYQIGAGWMQHLDAQIADTVITAPAPLALRAAMMFVYRAKLHISLGITGAMTTSGVPLPLPFINVQRQL